jgi:hypothetical protein
MYMGSTVNQNIHLLLPKDDLNLLKRRSKQEKKSIGELIRLAIKSVYGKTPPQDRQAAFERLAKLKDLKMDDWDQVKKDLLKRYE